MIERTEFSGAYLLDPGHGVQSEFHQMLAEEVAYRYPRLRLAQVPMHERHANEEFPFALVDAETGHVIKELRDRECNINFVFRWLYENDSHRHGEAELYKQYIHKKKTSEQRKAEARRAILHEQLDFVNTMQRSPLHTYRHNGRKIG